MDTDGDGRIARAEASADRSFGGNFSTADTNGDGYLSADEYNNRSSNSSSSSSSQGTSTRQQQDQSSSQSSNPGQQR